MNYNDTNNNENLKVSDIKSENTASHVIKNFSDRMKTLFSDTKKIVAEKRVVASLKKDGLFWMIRDMLAEQGHQIDPYSELGQDLMNMCFETTVCLQHTAKMFSEYIQSNDFSNQQKIQLSDYLIEFCDFRMLKLLDTQDILRVSTYNDVLILLIEEVKKKYIHSIGSSLDVDVFYSPTELFCATQFSYYQTKFNSKELLMLFPELKSCLMEGKHCKNTSLLNETLSAYYIGLSDNKSKEYQQFVRDFFESLSIRNVVWSFETLDKISDYFGNAGSFTAYCHFKQIQLENLRQTSSSVVESKIQVKNVTPNPNSFKSLDYMLNKVSSGIADIFNELPLGEITTHQIFELFFDQGDKKRVIKNQYADALQHWLGDRRNNENKMYALIHYIISTLQQNKSGKFMTIGSSSAEFVKKYWNKKYNAGLTGIQLSKIKKENGVITLNGKKSSYPFKAIYFSKKTTSQKA